MDRRPKRWPLSRSQESFYVEDAGCLSSLSSLFSTTSTAEPDPEAYLEPHPGTLYHPPRRRPFLFVCCRYREDVYSFLRARKKQRLRELRNCWHAVTLRLAAWQPTPEDYDAEDAAERWVVFLRSSRAFEALVRFLSLFRALRPSHHPPPELLAASPNAVDPTPLLAASAAAAAASASTSSFSDKQPFEQDRDQDQDQDQDEPVVIATQEDFLHSPERWC